MSEKDARTVQLKRVRLSFADGLKDKKVVKGVEGGVPKHNCNIILETDSPHFKDNDAKIVSAIRAAGEKTWKKPKAYEEILEDNPKRVFYKKGERFKDSEGNVYTGYEGNKGASCGTPGGGQRRPKLLDRRKRPVEEADIMDVFYSGVYADVIISVFGTDKGGKGIFCTLEAVRSHEEGESMGGGVHVDADDFDDLDDGDSFDKDESFDDLG